MNELRTVSNGELDKKPWNRIIPPTEILLPKGMLGEEERKLLYYLGAFTYQGLGVAVDAGAFIGASALALAFGLSDSSRRDHGYAQVYSYDLFMSSEPYVTRFLKTHFGLDSEEINYRCVFDYQTALRKERIIAVEGDFAAASVPEQPIELLFVDVAKTIALNSRIVREYFPKLIPGVSILVQQDYYHCWHPHIHITMQYLADYWVTLDPLIPSGSRLYRLDRRIPGDAIDRVADFAFTIDEQVGLLEDACARDAGQTKIMTRVAQIWLCMKSGRPEQARSLAAKLREDQDFRRDSYCGRELERVLNR